MEKLRDHTVNDLEDWTKRVEDIAAGFGLDWYPQEFEIVDYEMMLGTLAYHGIPSYYPHWSFGKAYERQATLYKYGLTYLPYELVINSNPSIAYLMNENPLPLQILIIAHVYAHNNFFKNNVNFQKGTRAELALEFFKASADRVRSYVSDPSIGIKKVEKCLDAVHALMYHRSRIPGATYMTQDKKLLAPSSGSQNPEDDQWSHLEQKRSNKKQLPTIFPIEPEENLLLFMRDNSPRRLEDWEKDLMTVGAESFAYFLPQIDTKNMNEGWASYWHNKIIRALPLSADMRLAIADYHSRVVRPPENPLSINPYHIGIETWSDIFRRYEKPTAEEIKEYGLAGGEGLRQIFHVMRTANDASFFRAYLTQELMTRLNLLSYKVEGNNILVDELSNDDSWKRIKRLLIRDVGLGSMPVIKITDADYEHARSLYLKHEFDGRNMDKEYTQRTLEHVYYFWGRNLYLETATYKRKAPFVYKFDGKHHFASRKK